SWPSSSRWRGDGLPRRRDMKRLMAVSTVLALLVLAGAAGAEVFVYPKQGQGQDQFQRDQFDCHNWAQGQTGVNPSQPVQVASAPPQQGGAIRGGARGAALGAVGGAIGGDAGKGAAIGAGVGALFGGFRRMRAMEEEQAQMANYQAQTAQATGGFNRAYSACLQGRGYTVQ